MLASDVPEIVPIPAAEFWMGQEDGRDEERPVHLVRLPAFGLARTQVTNAQYDFFCRETGRTATRFRKQAGFDHPQQPVTGATWFDAADYCAWLRSLTGQPWRLPSEAEWEWAARGGLAGRRYPWGDEEVTTRAGYRERWRTGPECVATSAANGYALFDICENVHEWCSDWYDPRYYEISPVENPQGPDNGSRRASRGGAWRHHIKIARCAARSSIPPSFEYADYGFRAACGSDSRTS